MQLSHLSIILENKWLNDNDQFYILAWQQADTLFVHNVSIFCGFRKIILGIIRKWSSEAALKSEYYLIDWHFRLTQFTAVLISNTASDGV